MTSARRGRGGFKNCPILRTNSTNRLHEMRMRERGGQKPPKFFGRSMYIVPNGAEERDVPRPYPSFLFFRVCVCRPLIALPAITAASFSLRLLFRPPSLPRPLLPAAFYAFPVICCPRQSARYQLNIILDTRQEKGPHNRHFELRPRILLLIGRY